MNQEITPLESVKRYWEDYNEKKYSIQEGTILEGLPQKTKQEILEYIDKKTKQRRGK
jgi:hypothetical protein